MRRGHIAIFGVTVLAMFMHSAPATLHAETLNDVLASAYMYSPQLKAERARLQELDENFVQTLAQKRFQASANASTGLTRSSATFTGFGGETTTTDVTAQRSISVTGQKLLFDNGRVDNQKSQVQYGILAAREQYRNIEQGILVEAATAYVDIIRDEEAARIRRNNILVLSRQRDAAQERFDVGVGTRTDIAQADARLAQAEIGLSQADAQLQTSRAAFERLTGRSPSDLQPIGDYGFPETREEALAIASESSPLLEASRYNEEAAQFGIDVAKSNRGPTLSAQSFIQYSAGQGGIVQEQDALGFSINFTYPFWTGGINDSRVRSAAALKNRTRFERRVAEDMLDEQLAVLWAQKDAAEIRVEASQRQVKAAEIAFEGVEIELDVGTRDSLDVLNAEQEVLNARLNLAQARRDLDVIKFQILALIGQFDAETLGLDVSIYDPQDNLDEVSSWDIFALPRKNKE